MINWNNLLEERPNFPVPSTHHQTLLSKATFSHFLTYASIACVALSSKSIQNSSLSPNIASTIIINSESVKLFETVFHPRSSLPLQFVPSQNIAQSLPSTSFIQSLKSTKYFSKSLRAVHLKSSSFRDFFGENTSLKIFDTLQTIILNECDVTESDVDFLNNNSVFPSLQSVTATLGWCAPNTLLILSRIEKLKTLTTSSVSAAALKIISECPNLQTLTLNGSERLTEGTGVEFLSGLKNSLTSLTIPRCTKISDLDVEKYLSSLGKLTSVELTDGKQLTDQALTIITASFPLISHLNLSRCQGISDESVKKIPASLLYLTSLNLSWNDQISNSSLQFISEIISLTNLELRVCKNLMKFHFLSALTRLRRLSLDHCKIDDNGLMELASLPELCSLSLAGCTNLKFGKKLPVFHKVEFVDLRGCFGEITTVDNDENNNNVVNNIAQSFPFVKELNLSSSNISDKDLDFLTALSHLEDLILMNCPNFSNEGIINLVSKLWFLRKLDISMAGPNITADLLVSEKGAKVMTRLSLLTMISCRFSELKGRGFPFLKLSY